MACIERVRTFMFFLSDFGIVDILRLLQYLHDVGDRYPRALAMDENVDMTRGTLRFSRFDVLKGKVTCLIKKRERGSIMHDQTIHLV